MEKLDKKPLFTKFVILVMAFTMILSTSMFFYQRQKEIEIENERKKKLLEITAPPGHKGVETGGEPSEPEAKRRRDFVRKVLILLMRP